MVEERCRAKILVWPAWIAGDGIPGVAECSRESNHWGYHEGPLLGEVETVWGGKSQPRFSWLEEDRRNFTGDLEMCPWRGRPGAPQDQLCVLPSGHPGNHAT
jgi:hypothetical protein